MKKSLFNGSLFQSKAKLQNGLQNDGIVKG